MFKPAPHKQKLLMSCLIGWAWFLAAAAPPASAEFQASVIAKLPDTPEGMAVDSKGNIYTTLFHTGEVIMLKDDGSYDHIAWVPSKEESGKGDLAELWTARGSQRRVSEERCLVNSGTVRWFNTQKGYGFIQPEGGDKDMFVPIGAVERAGLRELREGQRVSFSRASV